MRFSVVIPIFNKADTILETVRSVLAQSCTDYEIILVDDGSTDLSRKIADEYAKKEDRIKVIHQENEGASAARNPGLEIAQGEYIAFLDSEDWISWKDKHGSAGIWSPKRMIWESTTRK